MKNIHALEYANPLLVFSNLLKEEYLWYEEDKVFSADLLYSF